jgi:hypothetical protein
LIPLYAKRREETWNAVVRVDQRAFNRHFEAANESTGNLQRIKDPKAEVVTTVKIEHLQQLARSENGPYVIGELCRRLLYNWVPDRLMGMSFHSGAANNLPGWDGWVQLSPTEDQPGHYSLWELSTQDADRAKILGDVKKSFRRVLPTDWEHKRTIYVAVTLRKLSDKDGLEQEIALLPKNPWGYVRIIDAPALVQWIELCPAVETWCAENLGVGTGRFGFSLETFWRRWSTVTRPPTSTELLIAGRPQSKMDALFSPSQGGTLSLLTDSAEETAAYVYGYLRHAEDSEGAARALANALVITSVEQANRYADEPRRKERIPITILLPPANAAANTLANAGHYVINAIGRASPSLKPTIITRALRREFSEALQSTMAFTPELAEQQARACGASVSVWSVWNRFETSALDAVPKWCEANELSLALAAIFAAGWDENLQADKEALAGLSGREYLTFRNVLSKHTRSDPPLLQRVGNVYSVLAPTVAFALTAKSITKEQLEVLEATIDSVFSKIEGQTLAAWDAEPTSPLSTKRDHNSDWLKTGLMETLLRISAFSDVLDSEQVAHEFGGCQAYVDRVVAKNARFKDDARFLAALADNLPLMAEAAPLPFVSALEAVLQGSASAIAPLFADRGMFGPVMHAGLLWALECLAWNTAYLPRAASILVRLAELDVGGKVVNRPSNSLRTIFLAWSPGTSASLPERMEVLRQMNDSSPVATWQLVCDLLPRSYDSSTPTYEPVWKDFGRSNRTPPTIASVREAYNAYADFALELSDHNVSRQASLIGEIAELSPAHRQVLREQLRRSSESADLSDEVRETIWDTVRRQVAKHRRFSETNWAMKAEDVDAIEVIGQLFRPKSRLSEVQWLFDDYFPDAAAKTDDIEEAQRQLERLRDEAIRDVARDGVSIVDELFGKARYPYLVAQQAAVSIEDARGLLDLLSIWCMRMSGADEVGIRILCASRYAKQGAEWTNLVQTAAKERGWSKPMLGLCVADYPDDTATLKELAQLDPEAVDRYWKSRNQYIRTTDRAVATTIAKELIAHGRATELVNQKLQVLEPKQAMDAMRAAIIELTTRSAQIFDAMLGYHLKENFDWLEGHGDVSGIELAQMEFSLLPVLLGQMQGKEQLALHRALAQYPGLFVDFVCQIYRPAHQPEKEIEHQQSTSEYERSHATVAWRVLRAWRTPPGLNESGELEYGSLMAWLTEAREKARGADRSAVADQCIGAVLYHAPNERGTGRWPSNVLARVLEELQSPEIENGLQIEVHNTHGVTTRGVLDGGQLEREQASAWSARADGIPLEWHRAKRLCHLIAESWEGMARQMDEHAAQRRLKF